MIDSEPSRSFNVGDDEDFSSANDGWELDLAFDDPTDGKEKEEEEKNPTSSNLGHAVGTTSEEVEEDAKQIESDLDMSDMQSSASSSDEFFDVLDEEDAYASERKGAKCPLTRGSTTLRSLGSSDGMILFVPHTQV
jgi:hypothetical protein